MGAVMELGAVTEPVIIEGPSCAETRVRVHSARLAALVAHDCKLVALPILCQSVVLLYGTCILLDMSVRVTG